MITQNVQNQHWLWEHWMHPKWKSYFRWKWIESCPFSIETLSETSKTIICICHSNYCTSTQISRAMIDEFPCQFRCPIVSLRFVKHWYATQKSPQTSHASCSFLEFLPDFKEVNSSCGPMVFWNSPIIRTFNHMLSCRIVLGQFFNLVEKLVSLTPVTSVTERLSGGYTEALPPYLWSAPCLMGIHLNQDFPERHPSVLNPRGANCKSFSLRASIGGRLLAFQYLEPITTVCIITLIIFWILSVNLLIPHQLLK